MAHDDDLGPIGGVDRNGRVYGGRHQTRRTSKKPNIDLQVRMALDSIQAETEQPLTEPQLAHRLRLWLRDEYDTFVSEQEALQEVQKRHA